MADTLTIYVRRNGNAYYVQTDDMQSVAGVEGPNLAKTLGRLGEALTSSRLVGYRAFCRGEYGALTGSEQRESSRLISKLGLPTQEEHD